MTELTEAPAGNEGVGAIRLRALNRVSVLLPARRYKLHCAWTFERPLPAIEELTCRLLLVLGKIDVGSLQAYFGLSLREVDILADTLCSNRLVEFDEDGKLQASPLLSTKLSDDPSAIPGLTKYEVNDELAVFDLLTLQLLPRRNTEDRLYGLPEIPVSSAQDAIIDDRVIEAFGRQYRSHLEATRRSQKEKQATLYKVISCELDRVMQIPVDLEIRLQPQPGDSPKVTRDAVERIGETQTRPLSIALETKVSEYLSSLPVPPTEPSFGKFCSDFDDHVLAKYVDAKGFDFSGWLIDRQAKKTGYGSPTTIGVVGPIYSRENRVQLQRVLQQALSDDAEPSLLRAFWKPAGVPLWGASGQELTDFVRRIEEGLVRRKKSAPKSKRLSGSIIALFGCESTFDDKSIERRFKGRIKHALAMRGPVQSDRVELFIVPGVLAIAQFHVQPEAASAICVPIGFVTTDPVKIALVTQALRSRCIRTTDVSTLWVPDNTQPETLDWLLSGRSTTAFSVKLDPVTGAKKLVAQSETSRPDPKRLLSLKKPPAE